MPASKQTLSLLICLVLTGALAIAAAPASAKPRPDLLVSTGSVGNTNGQLTGSFVIRNRGRAKAKRSSAALIVRASGKKVFSDRFKVHALKRKKSSTVDVGVALPSGLPTGVLELDICADAGGKVRERKEKNNCLKVGTLTIGGAGPGAGGAGPGAGGAGGGTDPEAPCGPISSPINPVAFAKETVFTLNDCQSNYWIFVPNSYDSSNQTPITLLVWLHGCGGESAGDIYTVSPGGPQSYIAITVGGRETECWDPNSDVPKVLAAIADVKSHFNINPHRVIIGGYSSGGDLSYRTAFYHAKLFAGLLAENTSPFRDTGSTQAQSLAAAAWKFNVVHLAHTSDTEYPIAGVRDETDAMTAAGFPMTRIERAGNHYDPDVGATGTDHDLQTYLLPHIDDGWLSP